MCSMKDIVLFHIERNNGGKSVDMAFSGRSSFLAVDTNQSYFSHIYTFLTIVL
jgi:hypothetical protein